MATDPIDLLDVSARKEALIADLRSCGRSVTTAPGATLLPVRELSAKYGLAQRTVSLTLKKLSEEGVLHTVPRVGTFVGTPHGARQDLFIAIFPYAVQNNYLFSAMCAGFEERISSLRCTSLVLDREMAARYQSDNNAVAPAGIFEFHDQILPVAWAVPGLPHVEFGEVNAQNPETDMVYFDNVGGGKCATEHLLSLRHHRVAFLGVHAPQDDVGYFVWSKERAEGWRFSMNAAGLSTEGLMFLPSQTPSVSPEDVARKAREAAEKLLLHPEITAVVVVNSIATEALFEVLHEAKRPTHIWPAIVSFDTSVSSEFEEVMPMVTALQLPWEEIGREAANLLWERAQGRLSGPAQQRLVSMSLIPRLSSRQEWHIALNTSALAGRRKLQVA